MSVAALLQVSVATTPEAEEAVGIALEKVLQLPVSVYTNERTKIPHVTVYCPKLADWTASRHCALLDELRAIRAAGFKLGSGKISVRRLRRENWAESWKKHFKPMLIGGKLLVKPSWSRRRAVRGQVVVVLDPGLSFGTGQHATTSFCLSELVRCRNQGQVQTFLDIGTGSGILAISAAKLGYRPVVAFDFDPEAVRVARDNAWRNQVTDQVVLSQADVSKLTRQSREQYDLVCANLISNLLIAERERIIQRVKPGGLLVLAGILRKEFGAVQVAFEEKGRMKFLRGRSEREWRSGTFVRMI